MVDGIIFFKLPKKPHRSLEGYKISVALQDVMNQDNVMIQYDLHGDIKYKGPQKPRNSGQRREVKGDAQNNTYIYNFTIH